MSDIDKAFKNFCSGYDLYGDEWQDMGLDKVFAAGFKAALHQQEQAEPVGWVWDFCGQINFTSGEHHKEVLVEDGIVLHPVYRCPPSAVSEPTEYHAWAVVDAIDHDHADISDTVGYVPKALKAYHAMSAAPQPKETGE